MVGRIATILLVLTVTVNRAENSPDIRVKTGSIQRGVNTSEFDISENEIVVERGNTVEFICDGDYEVVWEYKENMDQSDRYHISKVVIYFLYHVKSSNSIQTNPLWVISF